MRAFVIEHRGGPGVLKELPDPQPQDDEVLVSIAIAGVNPVDWKNIEDPSHSGKQLPFVAGQDFAGVVEGLGKGVTRFAIGDRIFGIARTKGSYAEYTCVRDTQTSGAEPLCKIPDDVGDADAAAMPTPALTALASLTWLDVTKDSKLLVIGASGSVGGFAVQLAKLRGAYVIGTAHSGLEDEVRSLGGDDVIAYDTCNVAETLQSKHSGPLDAVLDLANGPPESKALAPLLRKGGKIVSTIGSIDIPWFEKHDISGSNLIVAQTPQSSHESLRYLIKLVETGDLKTSIGAQRALAEAAQALELNKSGKIHGKILLTVR